MHPLWTLEEAADLNRKALLRVLTGLCAMIGLVPGGSVASLPRHLHNRVRSLLLSAESATRRLIVIAAHGVSVTLRPPSPKGMPSVANGSGGNGGGAGFPLLDRQWHTGPPPAMRGGRAEPRIDFFDGSPEPLRAAVPAPLSDDPVDAARLCRRLTRVRDALDDLPKQARRLALWQARRIARRDRVPPGPLRRSNPLRCGRPPGHRGRRGHEIDGILADCRGLVSLALGPPDTS